MANLPAAGASQKFHLAYRKRGEIVVEHELLVILGGDVLDELLVLLGAQGHRGQRLSFATGEDRRSVCPGQECHLTTYRANVGESAAVDALALPQDHLAHDGLLEFFEHPIHLASYILLVILGNELGHQILFDLP